MPVTQSNFVSDPIVVTATVVVSIQPEDAAGLSEIPNVMTDLASSFDTAVTVAVEGLVAVGASADVIKTFAISNTNSSAATHTAA